MTDTPRFALPTLAPGQAQKEVTHNEALARIDAVLQLAVESRTVATPPAAVAGQAWIVGDGAGGAWAGYARVVAAYDGTGWTFVQPRDGCLAYVGDERLYLHFRGGSWQDAWPVARFALPGGVPIAAPSGGATVDAQARATLATLLARLAAVGVLGT